MVKRLQHESCLTAQPHCIKENLFEGNNACSLKIFRNKLFFIYECKRASNNLFHQRDICWQQRKTALLHFQKSMAVIKHSSAENGP